MAVMTAPVPTYDVDLFAPESLQHPFALYRQVRDIGPVVRMHEPDVLALSRFKDVQLALRSPAELISGDGVGFNSVSNERRAEPSTITSDGERHRRLRGQVSRPLMPAALKERRADLKAIITEQVQAVKGQGWIDGVQMLAQHLPVSAISFLVGLPDSGRANMLRWASAGFNFLGPHVEHLEEDLAAIREARQYLLDVNPDDLLPGSWSRSLFDSVEQGKLTIGEARAGLSGLVLPSLDTTIYASGNLLHNLGAHPDQWALLKERRELIPSAVVESVRHSAVVRWFSRVAVTDYQVEDITIPAGSRVMLMYGSANRDERRYENPDQFDVTRNPQDQLGWGTGPHMCAGMHLAKLEMEVLLEALLDNVDSVEVGEPVVGHSQGLYGFDRLPMRIH